MSDVTEYAQQSSYSDPGRYAGLLEALPQEIPDLTAVVRNVIVHYRAPGTNLPNERLAEINHRWLDRLLATDQARFGSPLAAPRPVTQRVAGCCRDYTLLTVAALRHRGVPARSRIGFASYFTPGYHHDHVVAEVWDGRRWIWVDSQIGPEDDWSFDPADIPHDEGLFDTAARVWTAYRAGEIDVDQYGVAPGVPVGGAWFVRDYVLMELAHRRRDELLLWDGWGAMTGPDMDGDHELVDDVAALLLAADGGDEAAERELAERYAADPRLHPAGRVACHTPVGEEFVVDLRTREPTAPA